jgi:hypothetical protein
MPRCEICKNKFIQKRSLQPVCDTYECKVAYALNVAEKSKQRKIKQEKTVNKELKAKLKVTATNWKVKLQTKLQEIARLIDFGLPCPSKGTYSKQDGGHVYAKGSHSEMRFNLHNIHRQSAQSNHWSNDDIGFRNGLISEYGQQYFDFVTSLKGTEVPKFSDKTYMDIYYLACNTANRIKKNNYIRTVEERIQLRNEINLELGIYKKEYCVFTL